MRQQLSAASLYGILDLGYVEPAAAVAVAGELLAGGADLLQLRAKGHERAMILDLGARLRPLCREAGVPLVINDFPELAAELEADGLHLGQDDGSLADARRIVGERMLVGRSTHSPEQARAALREGFDYIGFGPLFPTPTKLGRPGIGLADIPAVEREVGAAIPVFCIGGIKRANLPEVLAAGTRRAVIVSDLLQAPDVTAATKEARKLLIGDRGLRIAD